MQYEKYKQIQLVSPSSPLREFDELKRSRIMMNDLGYSTNIASDIFNPTLFCSNTDQYRAASFLAAVHNQNIGTIWAIRGGYGAARIIKHIAQKKIAQKQHFIGFSDLTALHIFLYQEWGWHSIHGLNYQQISNAHNPSLLDQNNFLLIEKILTQGTAQITIEDLQPLNQTAAAITSLESRLTGGNLSLIQSSIGTAWEIKARDHILLLEDVEEPAYKIDRMLDHLQQSNKLNAIRALVFGEFTSCQPHFSKATTEDALRRIASELDVSSIPVFQTQSIGHGYKNYPFVYGAPTSICRSNNRLTLNQHIEFCF